MSENNVDINDERSVRLQRLENIKKQGINPYPANCKRTHTVKQALTTRHDQEVTITGRVMAKRDFGKIIFADIKDRSGTIQIVFKHEETEEDLMEEFSNKVDLGDILQVKGERFKTEKNEESVLVEEWKFLAKSLRPLPEKFHGLKDKETRLRKRYLDFIDNPEEQALFERKAKFWKEIRDYLLKKDFLEVYTPVLEKKAGGAEAEPFVTHHNALGMDVFLRISMGELWQKRLMVGGFEKTFEIGRQFRNEGMSKEHLQDYTQMEFYWAYADYEDCMKMVESMFKEFVQAVWNQTKFDIHGFKGIEIDQNWEKIDYVETIEEKTGINVLTADKKEVKSKLDDLDLEYDESDGKGRLVDSLWKHCRKEIKGPCFLVNHPVFVSPLAKRKEDNPELTERFQVIIAGTEIANGYSELNDPIDQAERFKKQAELRAQGDEEAQMFDKDFVEALEHGMPPTTGFGMSVRAFAFFEDRPIRECVMFPLTRKKEGSQKEKVSHIILADKEDQPDWVKMNTASHLTASLAAREGASMIKGEDAVTSDGDIIPMYAEEGIVIKEADEVKNLNELKQKAQQKGFEVTCFTQEMLELGDSKKIKEKLDSQESEDVNYLGILIYGNKDQVEELTSDYKLAD
ncbi:MAG: lysine--tRNA ligase [Parcubacteria group bacterium QH_9_35_7]|nr:MAG: lysine--tRNA ligase [Parcubacteria group bacterium QH_9_35_7]